jgi:hypothetical protein
MKILSLLPFSLSLYLYRRRFQAENSSSSSISSKQAISSSLFYVFWFYDLMHGNNFLITHTQLLCLMLKEIYKRHKNACSRMHVEKVKVYREGE